MSEEIVKRLDDVQNSLLKGMGKEIFSNRLENIISLIERITRIKKIENEM